MENKPKELKLKKNIHCVPCEYVLTCKGAINPESCVNFKRRKEKNG